MFCLQETGQRRPFKIFQLRLQYSKGGITNFLIPTVLEYMKQFIPSETTNCQNTTLQKVDRFEVYMLSHGKN